MTVLENWKAYVAGSTEHDQYAFSHLIVGAQSDDQLREAFADIPQGEALVARITRLKADAKNSGYLISNPDSYLVPEHLIELATKVVNSAYDELNDMGEPDLAKQIRSNPFVMIRPEQVKEAHATNALALSEANDFLDDAYMDSLFQREEYLLGLDEAVHTLTKVYEVTRYIMSTVAPQTLNYEAAYELWLGGATLQYGKSKNYVVVSEDYSFTW